VTIESAQQAFIANNESAPKTPKTKKVSFGHLFTFFNPLILRHRLRVAAMAEQGITESQKMKPYFKITLF